IDLSDNAIPGEFPISILKCSKLKYLDLSKNHFVGKIPNDFSGTPNLFNGSFLPEIGNLSNLEALHLHSNDFFPAKIPPEFSRLVKLRNLGMERMNLYGEIPDWFGNFSNLNFL
ncbi:hypothetical protein MKX03_028548, partial [Papaver bracteatum]